MSRALPCACGNRGSQLPAPLFPLRGAVEVPSLRSASGVVKRRGEGGLCRDEGGGHCTLLVSTSDGHSSSGSGPCLTRPPCPRGSVQDSACAPSGPGAPADSADRPRPTFGRSAPGVSRAGFLGPLPVWTHSLSLPSFLKRRGQTVRPRPRSVKGPGPGRDPGRDVHASTLSHGGGSTPTERQADPPSRKSSRLGRGLSQNSRAHGPSRPKSSSCLLSARTNLSPT